MKTGNRAPFFSLIAVGSGRRVSLRETAGRPLILVFHGRGDEEAVREINRAVRERFPNPEDPVVASVIDLSFVPPFYWVAANMELDRAYRAAAKDLPPDADPEKYIVILPDWTGATTRKYRSAERCASRDGIAAAVIGADSTLLGVAGDPDSALDLLDRS